MKILSVITATYNSCQTLQRLIDSMRKSKQQNIEWIVIDGNSTDGTLDILRTADDVIDTTISEDDNGIYDAWNKGLDLCSGEYICFIGSDDYISEDYFDIALSAIDGIHNVIGLKVQLFDNDGPKQLLHEVDWKKPWNYPIDCGFHHQGTLYHNNLFKFNKFNSEYKILGDAEFNIRIADQLIPKIIISEKPALYFFMEGVSSSKKNILNIYDEKLRIMNSSRYKYLEAYIEIFILVTKKNIRIKMLNSQKLFKKAKSIIFGRCL